MLYKKIISSVLLLIGASLLLVACSSGNGVKETKSLLTSTVWQDVKDQKYALFDNNNHYYTFLASGELLDQGTVNYDKAAQIILDSDQGTARFNIKKISDTEVQLKGTLQVKGSNGNTKVSYRFKKSDKKLVRPR